MSRVTREINRISMMVIGLSGRLIAYALILVVLILGVRRAYEFGHSIFYSPGMEEEPGTAKTVVFDGDETVAEVGEILEEAGLIREFCAQTAITDLHEYTLYSSCEPCFMCSGAMVWAKLGRLVFGAWDEDYCAILPLGLSD